MAISEKKIDVDVVNNLSARLSQLEAMLIVTQDENNSFSRWGAKVQCDYLWACAEMANQAKKLSEKLSTA
ncbi:hypothetical protein LP43_1445 [Methylophaga thiooxydans]|uniref:Uncharacterized protein n=1 Tax=Methylophaga thiooxydans TaxID=392484 RepID=A0A0A0BGE0_9GAMM|nr:hypothetical protein [Methylophaga thiooxydans]KGM06950.1 hypothetical protein LP43_1445 [Methylophaga thiooxydans]